MSEQEEGALTCKVVLIGESGVGKTSIISRYITNTFKSQLMATSGANFVTKNLILEDDKEESQSIKFEIWDTAGQERYRSLAKVFYKNAAVCILVYDITRRSSLDAIKNYWFKEIKENAQKDVILALVGNKDDMYQFEEITNDEGIAFSKEIDSIYRRTSAKSGEGIDELFRLVGQKFLNPNSINTTNMTNEELKKHGDKLKREKIKNEQKKRNCC